MLKTSFNVRFAGEAGMVCVIMCIAVFSHTHPPCTLPHTLHVPSTHPPPTHTSSHLPFSYTPMYMYDHPPMPPVPPPSHVPHFPCSTDYVPLQLVHVPSSTLIPSPPPPPSPLPLVLTHSMPLYRVQVFVGNGSTVSPRRSSIQTTLSLLSLWMVRTLIVCV